MPRKSSKTAEVQEAPVAETPVKAKVRLKRQKASDEIPAAAAPVVAEVTQTPAPKAKTTGRRAKPAPSPEPATAATEAAASAALTPHAASVLEAIQAGKAIELIFTDPDANPPRTFEPRQLTFDAFSLSWFVWGWDRRYNAERHHRLDQIAEVNLVDGPGRSAQGPFPEGTPANQIGGWRGGEAIPVKATLLKQWIFAVRQAPAPFPDFKIEDIEDGKASVSFTATDLRAISRWCMQFGDGIQVLEPARLTDRIKQVASAWGARFPAPAPQKPQPAPQVHQKPEPQAHQKPESKPIPRVREQHREPRETSEAEASKQAKPSRIEIRIDRL